MECGMIHNENYITIQGWMINELKLKGNELLVYACIYGFSQTENQVFSGSRRYLANWANCTLQGVSKCLKSLYEKGYIDRKENSKNGVKFIDYWALPVSPGDNKVYSPRQQSLQGVGN